MIEKCNIWIAKKPYKGESCTYDIITMVVQRSCCIARKWKAEVRNQKVWKEDSECVWYAVICFLWEIHTRLYLGSKDDVLFCACRLSFAQSVSIQSRRVALFKFQDKHIKGAEAYVRNLSAYGTCGCNSLAVMRLNRKFVKDQHQGLEYGRENCLESGFQA